MNDSGQVHDYEKEKWRSRIYQESFSQEAQNEKKNLLFDIILAKSINKRAYTVAWNKQ